jgi:hypothetical protein
MRILLESENLTTAVVTDIEKIMEIILSSVLGPYVDIESFAKRLDKLQVKKSNINEPLKYNRKKNTLEINPVFMEEDHDYKFLLTKEVLSMLIPDGGFQDYPEFRALDYGIRDNFAEVLVGNEGKTNYENEKVIANLFALLFEQ